MPHHISESLLFGIDLGIGSCGWAVLDQSGENGHIEALGSWCFDVPETDKERTPTNQIRRSNRLLRRVIRRRRNRMAEIRRLFVTHGLLDTSHPDILRRLAIDPWEMRAQGLERQLTPQEFAVALAHIAKRRGFKSAAKRVGSNAPSDDSKMLAALARTEELSAQYLTIGQMFARHPDYVQRRRNRDGLFDRTMSRKDLEHETKVLFEKQRKLGSPVAGPDIEQAFTGIAFRQKPMQDSGTLVETCPFEPDEKRSSRFSPSFERFRLLCRLVNLRVTDGPEERPLTPEELRLAYETAGKTSKLTVTTIRKLLHLRDDQRFTTIPPDQETRDITNRTGETFAGTKAFRSVLGEALWQEEFLPHPERFDQAAWIISFHELTDTIIEKLSQIGLSPAAYEQLRQALESEKNPFAKFKGASSLSDKATRKLIPALQQGLTYDKACAAVGYNHAASKFSGHDTVDTKARFNALMADIRDSIANPIAKKALSEGMKQLWAMRNRWGLPRAIYIELARDVGNSLEKRREIERNIEATTKRREKERQEICELLKLETTKVSSDLLLRYRLWKEQEGYCCYSGKHIKPDMLLSQDNRVQVDHILPWSRFGDDSYNNKGLCLAQENQAKKSMTPYEWIHGTRGQDAWDRFTAIVEGNKNMKGLKKRNFLLKSSKETEKHFRSRNLNDTRYAARLMAEAACLLYPAGHRAEKGGQRHVFTRPGALTAALRHAWGVESLKKDKETGERLRDDRHHALDAAVVAAINEAEIQKLTKSFQECEQKGLPRPMRDIPEPWKNFRKQLKEKYETIQVARPERQRARGEGHAATIRQVRDEDTGPVIYERKAVGKLNLKDLANIKDPERNAGLIASLRSWIEAGKPADTPPRTPCATAGKGHEIRKVRLATRKKPAIPVRGGVTDRGDMTRVDIFKTTGKTGKTAWYMVPIYRHQVMNRSQWPSPPNRAAAAGKPEEKWPVMGPEDEFQFSLFPRSYVRVSKKGLDTEGYFTGCDRSTAAIALADPSGVKPPQKGIGIKTLDHIQKFAINRFGELSPIRKETRTWHGVTCTSPNQPD